MLRTLNSLLAILIVLVSLSSCGYLEAFKKRTEARQERSRTNKHHYTVEEAKSDDEVQQRPFDGSNEGESPYTTQENEKSLVDSNNNPSTSSNQNFQDQPPSYDHIDSVESFRDIRALPTINIESAEIIGQRTDGPIFTIAPIFELTNQFGEIVNQNSIKNGLSIMTFFFTRCPSICPTVSYNLKIIQQELADRGAFKILSISVDPKRDSVERLYEYSKNYEALPDRWNFLTGDTSTILTLYRETFKLPFDDSMGEMAYQAHSSKVFLVRNQTEVLGFYDGTSAQEMELLLEDAKRFIQ